MITENQKYGLNHPNDEISLKELILKIKDWYHYLLSKWVVIVICGLVGGALGFAYSLFKEPVYTATTTFVLEDDKGGSGLGSLMGLASIAGVDIGSGDGGIFKGDNILELYKSRRMIEQTLLSLVHVNGKEELLIDRYIAINQLRKQWEAKPELSKIRFDQGIAFTRLQDSVIGLAVKDINKNYLVVNKPDKKLSIIRAEVKSQDELFAKSFNDEIVRNVNDFYLQTKIKKSAENVLILQQKTDSVRAVMNGAIYQAAAVADATPNLNPTRQVQRIAPVQKSQFSAETNKAILSALVQNLEMSKIALRKETPLIQVVDSPIYPLTKDYIKPYLATIIGAVLGIFMITFFLLIRSFLRAKIK